MRFDLIVKNGLHFDGTGAPAAVREQPLDEAGSGQVVDAQGRWVVPGFVDIHTHYDAELLAAPALTESIRHGVTTVTVGSCSIGTILAEPEDCSDMFTRVEAVP